MRSPLAAQSRVARLWRVLLGLLFKGFVLLLLTLASLVAYLNTAGVPSPLAPFILERISSGSFVIQADGVRLKGVRVIVLKNAKAYRKCVMGQPVLEASRVSVLLDPLRRIKGFSMARWVYIEDSICRPDKARCPKPSPAGCFDLRADVWVGLRNCLVHDLRVDSLRFVFRAHRHRVKISDVEATAEREGMRGKLSGEAAFNTDSRILTGCFVSMMDPAILLPFVREYEMEFCEELIERFAFAAAAPRCEFNFERRVGESGNLVLNGNFRMRNSSYRGVDLLRGDGNVTVLYDATNSLATISDLCLVREEGMVRGDLAVNAGTESVDFDMKSTLHPLVTAGMIGGLTNFLRDNFTFNGPVAVEAAGVVDYGEDREKTDFRATAEAEAILVKGYRFDECSFNMEMNGRTNRISSIRGKMYGGDLSGGISFIIPACGETDVAYRVEKVSLDNAKFRPFLEAASGKEWPDHKGLISISADIRGMTGADHLGSLAGNGSVRVLDGRVFLMPVFGGLSRLMAKIIPGLDFVLRQSNASADFVINGGRMSSEKVVVEGDVLSLEGKGVLLFPDQLDFDVRVKLMKEHTLVAKLLRFVTYPISKLFEFRLKGSCSDPHWYPVNFSLDLLNRLGLRKEESVGEAE